MVTVKSPNRSNSMIDTDSFYQELLDLIGNSMTAINQNLIEIRKELKDLALQQSSHGHEIATLKSNHAIFTSIAIRTWIALIGAFTSIVVALIAYIKK